MSTHNIGFYEDLTKIILRLSSNFINYASYFFLYIFIECSMQCVKTQKFKDQLDQNIVLS